MHDKRFKRRYNIAMNWTRTEFLRFLGRDLPIGLASLSAGWQLAACKKPTPSGIAPSSLDKLTLTQGLQSQVLLSWGEKINSAGETFGFNCDFIAQKPLNDGSGDLLMMVNHEYCSDLFVSGFDKNKDSSKTPAQFEKEMRSVGVSIVRVGKRNGTWQLIASPFNKRIDALTPIPFASQTTVYGSDTAIGTFGNCAGGVTPWGSFLTCEENYELFIGEVYKTAAGRKIEKNKHYYGHKWETLDRHPEHYGWVVEINPNTAKAKKLTALGRFAHEGVAVVKAENKLVAYMGDDAKDQCMYKFISDKADSLEQGTLYVANTEKGKWLALDWQNPILKDKFSSQLDVLIYAREAAALLGGTPQNRPEDIEVDPNTGAVFVALTNNKKKGDYWGSLLKIVEKDNNPLSMSFSSNTFLAGGPQSGFSCPDNIAFDAKGNLWFTTDISGFSKHKDEYKPFGNNGLFVVPATGLDAGKAIQLASSPVDAEFTGPCFSNDGKTLFLSVQHPGETTKDLKNPTSHWPMGAPHLPKPSVIALSGPTLERFTLGG